MTETADYLGPRKGPGAPPLPEDRIVAARALYEGTPGMTIKQLVEKTGISDKTLRRYATAQNWQKNYGSLKLGEMTAEAQKAADLFNRKIEEFGPEITAEQQELITKEVVHQVAIDARAQMLDRHRLEWAAPRAMSAEAVKLREVDPEKSFTRAKLAKITAETLKIVQDGERKAWGLDVGEVPPGSVVVIERA